MSDRTAFFGETLEAARYRFGDTSTDGGDYVVAEDLDGDRVLLQFDYDADEWQYAGDVDMAGGDINSVGTARVDALEAERASIGSNWTTADNQSELDAVLNDKRQIRLTRLDDYQIEELSLDGTVIEGFGGFTRTSANSSIITGDENDEITISGQVLLRYIIPVDGGVRQELIINSGRVSVLNSGSVDATVSGDGVVFAHNFGIDVTFESGTSGGAAIANVDGSTITDNGNNEVLGNT